MEHEVILKELRNGIRFWLSNSDFKGAFLIYAKYPKDNKAFPMYHSEGITELENLYMIEANLKAYGHERIRNLMTYGVKREDIKPTEEELVIAEALRRLITKLNGIPDQIKLEIFKR